MIAAGFDWDRGNRAKCQKHGVSIEDVEYLMKSGPRIVPDVKHSRREDRFIAVGRSSKGRPMFVAFTIREKAGGEIHSTGERAPHAQEGEREV